MSAEDSSAEDPIWHPQQEKILKEWSEIGSSYRYLHDKAFQQYSAQNLRFALPVIIISTITGTANFAQGTFPEAWQPYVPLGIGTLNLAALSCRFCLTCCDKALPSVRSFLSNKYAGTAPSPIFAFS